MRPVKTGYLGSLSLSNPVFVFFREFQKHHIQTGSIVASSQALAQCMASQHWGGLPGQRILEVGAGTGVISEHILRRMDPADILKVVEINPFLSMHTRQRLTRGFGEDYVNNRVEFITADFMSQRFEDNHFDRVCCSLPLNNFMPALVSGIFEEMFRITKPGGTIVFFEYILLRRLRYWCFPVRNAKLLEIEKILNSFISRYCFDKRVILTNLPPARAYFMRKT